MLFYNPSMAIEKFDGTVETATGHKFRLRIERKQDSISYASYFVYAVRCPDQSSYHGQCRGFGEVLHLLERIYREASSLRVTDCNAPVADRCEVREQCL